MDKREYDNWRKIKESLEEAEKTDSFFYERAKAICEGRPDPFLKLNKPDA